MAKKIGYQSLTAVLHADVKNAPSGLDARTIADLLGKPYATLMSELSRQEGHKLGADFVLPIMDVTDSRRAIKFLARELGGVYVEMPTTHSIHPLHRQCMAAVKDFGNLMSEMAQALDDGRLSKEENNRIARAGHDVLATVTAMLRTADLATSDGV